MSSRADDEESSIILQNKMAHACGVPVHTHRAAPPIPDPEREISRCAGQEHDVRIIGAFVEELCIFFMLHIMFLAIVDEERRRAISSRRLAGTSAVPKI